MDRFLRSPALILLAALLLCGSARAVEFTPEELATLGRGDVVRRELPNNGKDGRFGGSGWAVIDASPDAVWTTIQTWKDYPAIFPNTVETTELSRKNGHSLIRMRLGHPLISVTYHVEMTPDRTTWTMRFTLVENLPSDLDDIDGYWRLFPMPDGRTLVLYVLNVHVPAGIANILPDSFKRMAVNGLLGVPGMVKEWMDRRKP